MQTAIEHRGLSKLFVIAEEIRETWVLRRRFLVSLPGGDILCTVRLVPSAPVGLLTRVISLSMKGRNPRVISLSISGKGRNPRSVWYFRYLSLFPLFACPHNSLRLQSAFLSVWQGIVRLSCLLFTHPALLYDSPRHRHQSSGRKPADPDQE